MKKLICISLFAWMLASCSGPAATTDQGEGNENSCGVLDSVFKNITRLEDLFTDSSSTWAMVKQPLQEVLDGIGHNIEIQDSVCQFLNSKIHPEVERFAFVESLRRRIVRDTIDDGIYFLIRLRGIFSNDNDIQEFFSEEIAHIAYSNPLAYLGYLRRDPGQREMLLNTTRWSIFRDDSLLARFNRLEEGKGVAAFLEKIRQKNEPE